MKKISKIFKKHFFYNILLFIVVVLAVFIGLASYDVIPGGPKLFVVLSGSMAPEIRTGSVVAVTPVDQYKVGDVVTFGSNSGKEVPTTHRVVEIKDADGVSMFLTKGDANNAPDVAPVNKEAIKGKVLFSVPYVGYLISAAKTKQGMLVLIVVGAIIIYSELMRIQQEIKDISRRKKEAKSNTEKNENFVI